MQSSLEQNKISLINEISKFFEKDFIENLARETGFVQRESKLQGLDFLLLCVFAHQKNPEISLNEMCGDLMQKGIYLCKQSLHDRFNDRSVEFMRQIVGQALSIKVDYSESLLNTGFNRIIIGDSTSFLLPNTFWTKNDIELAKSNNNAIQMIQYRYDLISHEIVGIESQTGVHSDAKSPLCDLVPNDLIIEDLGYFKFDRFRKIKQSGAFFLSRLRFDIAVYEDKGQYYQKIELLKILRSMKNNQIKAFDIYLGDELLPARLIIEKVPKKAADERRRKLKANKQYKRSGPSQRRLALCDINAYITNTTETQLPCLKVRQCYGLRWQIEIIFKTWKSTFNLNKVKSMAKERFECFHYGCLMLIIISSKITGFLRRNLFQFYQTELSELKAYRAIINQIISLYYSYKNPSYQIRRSIEMLIELSKRTCLKEHKKNKSNPLVILENFTLT